MGPPLALRVSWTMVDLIPSQPSGKTAVGAGAVLAGIRSMALSAGLSLGARHLLGSLLEDPSPSRYQFDQPQPEVSGVKPIPLVLGRVRVSGNVIAIDDRGRDRYLNAVYALSEGPVSDVYDIRALNNPPQSVTDDFIVRGPAVFLGERANGFRVFAAAASIDAERNKFYLPVDQDYPYTALVWAHLRATPETMAGLVPPLTWTVDGYRCTRIYDDPGDTGRYGTIHVDAHNRWLDIYDSDLGAEGYLHASMATGTYHLTTWPTTSGGIARAMADALNAVTSSSTGWQVIYSTPTASDRTMLCIQRDLSGHGRFQLLAHTGFHQAASIWEDAGWTEHSRRLILNREGELKQEFAGPDVEAQRILAEGVYRATADHPFLSTFSRNPARILYTLLTDERIGAGIPKERIDRISFDQIERRADECVDDSNAAIVRLGSNSAIPKYAKVITNAVVFSQGGRLEILENGVWRGQTVPPQFADNLLAIEGGAMYLDLSVANPYVAIVFEDEYGNIHPSTFGALELGVADYTTVASVSYTCDADPDPENEAQWTVLDIGDDIRGRFEFPPIVGVTAFRLSEITSIRTVNIIDKEIAIEGYTAPLGKLLSFKAFQASQHLPPRYRLDLVLDRGQPFGKHLEEILATFRAALIEQDGLIGLRLFEDGPVQQCFDEDDIIAGTFVYEYPSLRDTPNRFTVVFRDADNLYYPTAVTFDDEVRQRAERRIRSGAIRLDGITRRVQAELLASYLARAARYQLHSCRFQVHAQGFRRAPMDLISVGYPPAGYARRTFRIVGVRPDERGIVTLECLEHVAALDRDVFPIRPRDTGAGDIEPSPYLSAPDDLLFEDSVKRTWASKLISWGGGGSQWYRPILSEPVTRIDLPTQMGVSDVHLVMAGNAVLRRKIGDLDDTGEWSLVGNQLILHGFSLGPDDDVRITYVSQS